MTLKVDAEKMDQYPHISKGAQALRTVYMEGANSSVSMDALQFIMTCSWGENGEETDDTTRLSKLEIST